MLVCPLLVLAVLAQPVAHRLEVLGRDGEAFLATGAPGSDLWDRVRGDVRLDARRAADGAASAALVLSWVRGAERWTVELSSDRPAGLFLDADLPGPGGLVHAAAAFGGTARVTRVGETISQAASLRVVVLTTGFHADDGTFRTLPAGRSGDHELLVHLEGLPARETIDLGFEHPEIRLDGRLLPSAPMADASAPAWPGASLGPGVGGSGRTPAVLPGPVPPLVVSPPPASEQAAETAPPPAPTPLNAEPAGPLPTAPPPGNARPAEPLPPTPGPANASPGATLPSMPPPGPSPAAPPLPTTPAPGNAAPASPLPATPAPANSSPALPLPATPPPASPAHGERDVPPPTRFPERQALLTARASKIDPSGHASTVRLRVQLRARTLDLSRNFSRVPLADRG